MGSEQGEPKADEDEFGNSIFLEIPDPYWISRYPVTVAQFGCFVEEAAIRRSAGGEPNWRRNGCERINLPLLGDGTINDFHPTLPVMNVTWFEAMAYCAWLDAQLRQLNGDLIPAGYEVRLPTEAE